MFARDTAASAWRTASVERPRGADVVDQPVFEHEGPWTEDAYLELRGGTPRGAVRVEVVDGTLLLGPATTAPRAEVVDRMRTALSAALPDGLMVVGPLPLRLGPDCLLVPDLVVTSAAGPDGAAEPAPDVLDASAALMVVEVVGRDHGAIDRSFKPQLYARSRIPYFVMVDHDSRSGSAAMIISGRYHEYARADDGAPLRLEEPFGLEIDLAGPGARSTVAS